MIFTATYTANLAAILSAKTVVYSVPNRYALKNANLCEMSKPDSTGQRVDMLYIAYGYVNKNVVHPSFTNGVFNGGTQLEAVTECLRMLETREVDGIIGLEPELAVIRMRSSQCNTLALAPDVFFGRVQYAWRVSQQLDHALWSKWSDAVLISVENNDLTAIWEKYYAVVCANADSADEDTMSISLNSMAGATLVSTVHVHENYY